MHNGDDRAAAAWRAASEQLSQWAWDTHVVRTDVWGRYLPLKDRGKKRADGTVFDKSWTAPAPRKRGQQWLTRDVLRKHFEGHAVEHVVGVHTTSLENLSRWGATEVDWHGPTSTSPAVNLRAAHAWYERGRCLGFAPLLTDSNGTGGYHLRFLFNELVPTPQVYGFLKWLTADYATYGMVQAPETFPKQPTISPGRYGNWLRLPGRHHTREHWSRIWDGHRWLDGEDAVVFLLGHRGDPPAFIPPGLAVPTARRAPQQPRDQGTRLTPEVTPRENLDAAGVLESLPGRIARYMARLPNLGEAQGRDDVGYGFACFLVRDLQLSDAEALVWLQTWDSQNSPPKGEVCCQKWIASAHLYGRSAYGAGLVPRTARRKQAHHPKMVIRCEGTVR